MPICEADPWRLQYFRNVDCPPDLNIPTEDFDAWAWYPRERWVYDKVAVAHSQGLEAGPHGTKPSRFPVFSKPIVNLKGMGIGSRAIRSAEEYDRNYRPGHMWMPLLEGAHVSSDVAVVDGSPRWWRHATGKPGRRGTFDFWTIEAAAHADIEQRCGGWITSHLAGYTGMLNLETIDGTIIEAHLRLSDQWPDLYGRGWVDALMRLYRDRTWQFDDRDRRDGYSVVLFGRKGPRYRHPPDNLVEELRRRRDVSSVQITFHEGLPASQHAMPPGGFRLAVVNSWDLSAGREAREQLKAFFASAE